MAITAYKNFEIDIVRSLRTGWFGACARRPKNGDRIFTNAVYHSPDAAWWILKALIDTQKRKESNDD